MHFPTNEPVITQFFINKHLLVLFVLSFFILSCSPRSSETDQALEMAEDKKNEIERVLKYYHEIDPNSEKLKAAEYLIFSMIHQYSIFGYGVDSLNKNYKYAYEIYRKDRDAVSLSDFMNQKGVANVNADYDLKQFSSKYLISQIESAYEIYERYEWCKWYPFEVFCEYILPYKIGYTDTVTWRSYASKKYGHLLDYVVFKGPESYHEAERSANEDSLIVKLEGASGNFTRKLDTNSSTVFELEFHTRWKGYQLFNVHYVNGHYTAANIHIMVDSLIVGNFVFPSTGSWQNVRKDVPPVNFTVALDSGSHTLKVVSLDKDILLDFIYMPEYIYMKFPNSVISDGQYYLTNSFGRLTIDKDSLINETNIKIHPNPSVQWPIRILSKGNNLYQMVFEQDSVLKKALDAFPFGDSDWVLVYNDHGYPNQQWACIPVGEDGYQIRNKETGKILAYSEKDSVLIQLPVELMRDEYIWYLEKVKNYQDKIEVETMEVRIP